jgi:hypothetical protein
LNLSTRMVAARGSGYASPRANFYAATLGASLRPPPLLHQRWSRVSAWSAVITGRAAGFSSVASSVLSPLRPARDGELFMRVGAYAA